MNTKLHEIKSVIPEEISISLIKEITKKLSSDNNKFNTEVAGNMKLIDKFGLFSKNNLKPKFIVSKLNKYLNFINKVKNIVEKEYTDNSEIKVKNKIIFIISLYFLRININKGNHYKIRNFLKSLLILYINGKIHINNLFFILEILLISIIETLKKNNIKQYQIFDINNEPLLFIKDIIETVINFPIILMKNNIFIENLVNIFNKFFEYIEKSNIILKENELWIKLLENNNINNSFELYEDKSYNNSIKKVIDFLKEIYKNNIPNKFYTEIYEKSSIDFLYYMNVLTMINVLIQKEIIKQKNIKLNKGVYLFENYYIRKHFTFSSNEFSIIFSFKLLNLITEASIFNLIQKEKEIFCISIKNNCLNININNDFKWTTNNKIKKNIFYYIIITYNRKNKLIKLYVNYDEIYNKKIEDKTIEKGNVNFPKFGKDMDCIIGDTKLSAILGDIFFINKEFNIKNVIQLFNSKGYYPNLIIRNNVNCDLIINMIYSKNYKEIFDSFHSLQYEYILIFTPKLLLKENSLNNSLIEFNGTDCYNDFFNSKGIEFLTFMLHNFDGLINDSKLLNQLLSKTIEFISNILEYRKNPNNDYIIEFSKEDMKNKLNIFFLTIYFIFNSDKDNKNGKNKYYRILSDDIWYNLLIIFSSDLEKTFIYKKIILSILLDNDLFELKNYITQLNNILDKIEIKDINIELLYKLFYADFILESKNIKHKKYLNIINTLCFPKYKYFSKILIQYVIKIESEKKKLSLFKNNLYKYSKFKKHSFIRY